MHVHPGCADKVCKATGLYQGDDGESLDNIDYQVIVEIAMDAPFDASKPTEFNLTVSQQVVNGDSWFTCDNVGDLVIYNAKKNKMNQYYDVKFTFKDSSLDQVIRKGATYNETTD